MPKRDRQRMKPRVLRIITRLNVGGPATHVLLADRGLRALGWETLLLHGDVEPDEAEIDLASADVPMLRIASLRRPIRPVTDARALASVVATIRRYRPHVIHTHLSKAGLVGRAAALVSSRAVRVHTFHGTIFGGYFGSTMSGGIVRAERVLGARTDRIVALSPRQRDELVEHRIASAERIEIVPLGVDLARFGAMDRGRARASLGIDPDVTMVVAIGRLVPIKRIDRLIEALAIVRARVPSVELWLVGDGSERDALEALTRSLGLSAAVHFVGWSASTPAWYAAADIVGLTSEREGTPLALIEAAASGRPVVAMDSGGVADIVRDGITGFVVPGGDIEAFADRLTALATDPAERDRMGTAAPDHARAFDGDRLVHDLDGLYRRALHERSTR
jgi:glycosyltransferase involved in cell wall biosynthesis